MSVVLTHEPGVSYIFLQPGNSKYRNYEKEAIHWYSFYKEAGTTYTIESQHLNTYVRLLGQAPTGLELISVDHHSGRNNTSKLTWTRSENGSYFITVQSLYNSGYYDVAVSAE